MIRSASEQTAVHAVPAAAWLLRTPRDDRPAALRPATAAPAVTADHLGRAFETAAVAAVDRPALVTDAGEHSYAALLRMARAVRDRLRRDDGFRPGDRVVLLVGNGPEYVAGFYGTLLAGGVVVPLPPGCEAGRLRQIVESTSAKIVLTAESVLRRRSNLAFLRSEPLGLIAEPLADATKDEPPGGDALAALFFTSGSTGEPKGVMLSHRNLLANAASIRECLGITADERALGLLPFCHAFGNSVLQTHLLAGASIALAGSLLFPETILDAVREHRVTSVSGVPDLFHLLLSRTTFGQTELPSLRTLAVAGGRFEPDAALVTAARAAPARLFVMYGQSEATARLSCLPPELLESRYGSIGRGIPGVELQVVDEAGRPVPPGEIGELRARGPNVMLGYWNDPAGTAEVLRDGWLRTGDLATADADGFVYPQGRRSGLAKIGGHRVHPRELEEFVRANAAVAQAVAVAYETPDAGTRFALFARPADEAARDEPPTADGLRRLCARDLPRHLVPGYVEVVERFPLNDVHKIDRVGLRRRAEEAAAVAVT